MSTICCGMEKVRSGHPARDPTELIRSDSQAFHAGAFFRTTSHRSPLHPADFLARQSNITRGEVTRVRCIAARPIALRSIASLCTTSPVRMWSDRRLTLQGLPLITTCPFLRRAEHCMGKVCEAPAETVSKVCWCCCCGSTAFGYMGERARQCDAVERGGRERGFEHGSAISRYKGLGRSLPGQNSQGASRGEMERRN